MGGFFPLPPRPLCTIDINCTDNIVYMIVQIKIVKKTYITIWKDVWLFPILAFPLGPRFRVFN
jgi:hypothetical protein